jgi:dihydrofolate reductase
LIAGLTLVLAVSRNGVIGKEGKLPWHIPEDLKHFRKVTTGHAVIMGRKTFESIGKPLPNRRNIVVTRNATATFPGCETASSLEQAIALAASTDPDPCIIGGAALFREGLELATRIELTEIGRDVEGETRFEFDRSPFRETERRAGEDPDVTFVTLVRR